MELKLIGVIQGMFMSKDLLVAYTNITSIVE